MPVMSGAEQMFCRSTPWRWWTRTVVLPWALQGVQLHGDVLEIGAGAGATATGTVETYPDVRLTLTDIDPKMVAEASKAVGDHPRVLTRQADTTRLPFEDDSFDYCVSYLMLHHVIEWRPALAELRRVLRPGGRLMGYDLTDTRLARTIHIVDKSPHSLIAPGDLEVELVAAGFGGAHVSTSFGGHVMRFEAKGGER